MLHTWVRRVICGTTLTALALVASAAQAGHWGAYGGPYLDYGYRGIYVDDPVPYYAAHPPVYYSYPVARTYGYSPFAYPPGVMTPDPHFRTVEVVAGYTASALALPGDQPAAPQPKLIKNPHVK